AKNAGPYFPRSPMLDVLLEVLPLAMSHGCDNLSSPVYHHQNPAYFIDPRLPPGGHWRIPSNASAYPIGNSLPQQTLSFTSTQQAHPAPDPTPPATVPQFRPLTALECRQN